MGEGSMIANRYLRLVSSERKVLSVSVDTRRGTEPPVNTYLPQRDNARALFAKHRLPTRLTHTWHGSRVLWPSRAKSIVSSALRFLKAFILCPRSTAVIRAAPDCVAHWSAKVPERLLAPLMSTDLPATSPA